MIQTLQRICALLAVADTELPFSWMAARSSAIRFDTSPWPRCTDRSAYETRLRA